MRRSLRRPARAMLFILLLGATVAAAAQELSFHCDPSKSNVEFTLGDVLHTVHGTFRLKESTIEIDPATGKASGAIIVDATSGVTGNDTRDHKMHKEILESAKYPEIRFTVQSIQGSLPPSGASEVKLSGVLSIHGSDHPLTVTVSVHIDHGQASADVRFVVPYVQWGMKDPSTFVLRVSKEVDITAHLVGSLAPAPQP